MIGWYGMVWDGLRLKGVVKTWLNLRLAVGHFVVALVGFHIERHAAFCASETRFVPCLKRKKEGGKNVELQTVESEKLLRMQYYYCYLLFLVVLLLLLLLFVAC